METGFLVHEGRELGFYILTNTASDKLMKEHGPYHFTVYSYLTRIIDRNTMRGSRAINTIADATGMSESKARRVLNDLKDNDYILIHPRKDEHGRDLPPDFTVLEGRVSQKHPRVSQGQGRVSQVNPTQESNTPTEVGGGSTNPFTTFCERMKAMGQEVSPEDRKQVPGNLKRLANREDVDSRTLDAVINEMVASRIRGFPDSPQRVFQRMTGTRPQRKAKTGGMTFDEIPEM